MAQQNRLNNKSSQLTVDPGSSGDSFVQFDINATGEFRSGVDDTDDSFRLSQGSALGTNDTLIITPAGEITLPLTPAFQAQVASNLTNLTGDGTAYTVVFGTETFDQNNDFDGTSTFTAPVTGRYFITGALYQVADDDTLWKTTITTSNRTYSQCNQPTFNQYTNYYSINFRITSTFRVLADMDATDTATIVWTASGGTKLADLIASQSYYSAVLL